MTKIKCPECDSTFYTKWTESDAAYEDEDFIPNSFFCFECGEVFQANKEK